MNPLVVAVAAGVLVGLLIFFDNGETAPAKRPDPPKSDPRPEQRPPQSLPGSVTRAEAIATARAFAAHTWTCRPANMVNHCVGARYSADWSANEQVQGVAYNWGGTDGPEQFDQKLGRGFSAGAHSRHGVNGCSTGIDCSAFVSYCWGIRGNHGYSSTVFSQLSSRVADPFRNLRPGDALVKPGVHLVLFAGYRPDGNPTVYEAAGAPGRVVFNNTATWARYSQYYAVRCSRMVD